MNQLGFRHRDPYKNRILSIVLGIYKVFDANPDLETQVFSLKC